MRAFVLSDFDTPPQVTDLPDPDAPGPGEVAVAIHACGVNFADTLMCSGKYQDIPPLPAPLGLEAAGEVTAVGAGVTRLAPGDRVAVSAPRSMAEAGVFEESRCALLPAEMPFVEAAGFQVAYGTSHTALERRARLKPGEMLLVLGAAGGVGLTAVEVGKVMGARVIACARGADKLEVARAAGADHLIDADADLRAEVKALGGADVVYDPVGGDLFTAALRACRPEARVLAIGFASGTVPEVKPNHLLVKNIALIGHYWGGYAKFAPDVITDSLSTLAGWYAEGRLKPHVSHVLPLEEAPEALALLRERRSTGKVVVTLR